MLNIKHRSALSVSFTSGEHCARPFALLAQQQHAQHLGTLQRAERAEREQLEQRKPYLQYGCGKQFEFPAL